MLISDWPAVFTLVCQEDSDVLSVVSSYCDVSRRGRGFEDGSLCILSADCDLYVCDGDDDQSSDR